MFAIFYYPIHSDEKELTTRKGLECTVTEGGREGSVREGGRERQTEGGWKREEKWWKVEKGLGRRLGTAERKQRGLTI